MGEGRSDLSLLTELQTPNTIGPVTGERQKQRLFAKRGRRVIKPSLQSNFSIVKQGFSGKKTIRDRKRKDGKREANRERTILKFLLGYRALKHPGRGLRERAEKRRTFRKDYLGPDGVVVGTDWAPSGTGATSKRDEGDAESQSRGT